MDIRLLGIGVMHPEYYLRGGTTHTREYIWFVQGSFFRRVGGKFTRQ